MTEDLKDLLDKAVACEKPVNVTSLPREHWESRVKIYKDEIKTLNKKKKLQGLTFGETVKLSIAKQNLRGAENALHVLDFKAQQQERLAANRPSFIDSMLVVE